jgi:hypothetical protein
VTPEEIRKIKQDAFRQGWDAAKDEWFPIQRLIQMWLKAESALNGTSPEDTEEMCTWLEQFHWDVFTLIAPYMKGDKS